MHGVIMVKETKNNVGRAISVLAALLDFVLVVPFPKFLLRESKFVTSGEGCVMRGLDVETKVIKSMHIEAGKTRLNEVRDHFSITL
jgi:hypothetical protein